MFGLPFRLLMHGDSGPADKVVYLRTQRSGDDGRKLREAKGVYRKAMFALARAGQRLTTLQRQLAELPAGELAAVQEAADFVLAEIQGLEQAALEAGEKIVRLALRPNYGDKLDEILDQLTDRDIRGMVGLIETGELPADFFESSARPPKPTTTSPSGAPPAEPCSATGTRRGRSKAEKSDLSMPSC